MADTSLDQNTNERYADDVIDHLSYEIGSDLDGFKGTCPHVPDLFRPDGESLDQALKSLVSYALRLKYKYIVQDILEIYDIKYQHSDKDESIEKVNLTKPRDWIKLPGPHCDECKSLMNTKSDKFLPEKKRLFACISCVHISCMDFTKIPPNMDHMAQHFKATGHAMFLDLENLRVYCVPCADYQCVVNEDKVDWFQEYYVRTERVWIESLLAQELIDSGISSMGIGSDKLGTSRSKLVQFESQKKLNDEKCDSDSSSFPLVGLHNLGSTCFMNVCLQALLHNPPLRNWFLSGKHYQSNGKSEHGCAIPWERCLACQLDYLFNRVYSPELDPPNPKANLKKSSKSIAPTTFLYTMWMACTRPYQSPDVPLSPGGANYSQLVGYDQHDAHEFFIGMLDKLHVDLVRCGILESTSNTSSMNLKRRRSQSPSRQAPKDMNSQQCSCIIHHLFSGQFMSTLECQSCGWKTTVIDPFLDCSLDVVEVFSPAFTSMLDENSSNAEVKKEFYYAGEKVASFKKNTDVKISSSAKKKDTKLSINASAPFSETHTLFECLETFTRRERLNPQDYSCKQCEKQKASSASTPKKDSKSGTFDWGSAVTKQLSIWSMPIVLSLQLKRYGSGQSLGGKSADKNSLMVSFPLDLDMFPYTTVGIDWKRRSVGKQQPMPTGTHSNQAFMYTLFCVVVHYGTLNSGHYICYIRKPSEQTSDDNMNFGNNGEWYRYDDSKVEEVSWDEVKSCEAYMLFYVKKKFEYEE